MNNTFMKYAQPFRARFIERKIILNYLTACERLYRQESIAQSPDKTFLLGEYQKDKPKAGDVVQVTFKDTIYLTIYDGEKLNIIKEDDGSPLFGLYEEISLNPGDIENYTSPSTVITTVGRFFLNQIVLASVFGSKIPYVNEVWNIGKVEGVIAKGLIDKIFTMQEYRKYMDHGYFIGHMAEVAVPTITARSFTTDPAIKQRKKELLEQYKNQLNDPVILAKIERELLDMDRAYLAGDPSLGFHLNNPGKSLDIHRKKLFVSVGGIEDFTDGASTYINVPNSLSEGWDKEKFPVIANEIRMGSYSRGKETAKGGAQAKMVFRAFQDVKITSDDCGTKRGQKFIFSRLDLGKYHGRTMFIGTDTVLVDATNEKNLMGKPVKLRGPQYCEQKDGYCYTCCGDKMRSLGITGMGAQALDITAIFMVAALKKMHGTKLSIKKLNYSEYLMPINKKDAVVRVGADDQEGSDD